MKKLALAIVSAIALTATVASAGPVGGPKEGHDTIRRGYSQTFTLVLRGGEPSIVAVAGDDSSDLDCWLYDENGVEVDHDTDQTDTCRLVVQPRWTGMFILKVSNVGTRSANYAFRAQ